MNQDKQLFNYESFLQANSKKFVGPIDYVSAIYKLACLPIDFILSYNKLIIPELLVIDNLIFIKDCFNEKTYNEYLSDKRTNSEIQLWLNLVEITAIFEEIDENAALDLSFSIIRIWNMQIESTLEKFLGRARVILDEDTREVFITIDQFQEISDESN